MGTGACHHPSRLPRASALLHTLDVPLLPLLQEILVGTDKFTIPEVLFNPPLVEGYAPGGGATLLLHTPWRALSGQGRGYRARAGGASGAPGLLVC